MSVVHAEADVSLSLSMDASKTYSSAYRIGLVAYIHNVTVNGRLTNVTSGRGMSTQPIAVYYTNVSRGEFDQRQCDGSWRLIEEVATDAEGYYSLVWVPPVAVFYEFVQQEVVYQVKVAWRHDEVQTVNVEDIFISPFEYAPPPREDYGVTFARPFVFTGLLLCGAGVVACVLFKEFGGAREGRERSRLDGKGLLGSVLAFTLLLTIALGSWIPLLPFLPVLIVVLYLAVPVILLVSVRGLTGHFRRGNRLKAMLACMVIVWAALLVVLLLLTYMGSRSSVWVLQIFFPGIWAYPGSIGQIVAYVYLNISTAVVIGLFVLLSLLKGEREDHKEEKET